MISDNKQIDGIYKKNDYIFWNKVSVIDNYILEFLKNKFPNSLILPEFTMIDWFVLNENLPIEIQSTIIKSIGSPAHSAFEDHIRQQIEQNIKNYEKCWFFFDSEYLRYLQNDIERNISINYDWLYKLLKCEKLKIFTCSYDGNIVERTCEDFGFIKKFSSTCELGDNDDHRILQKNKSIILLNVFNGNLISTDDVVKVRQKLLEIKQKNEIRKGAFYNFIKYTESGTKEKTICYIYKLMGNLERVNMGLNCNIEKQDVSQNSVIFDFDTLSLTEQLYGGQQSTIRQFVDKNNICQYFPGYLRNKEKWDFIKNSKIKLNRRQLNAIITGKINPLDWNKLIDGGW